MSNVIVLNSSNVVGANQNEYVYKFINGSFKITEGSTISLRNLTIPYSWFNVNSTYYNNASFSYTWVDGTTFVVNLQNGFYTTQDLFQALQNDFIANGLYLIDSTGENQYYIQLYTDLNLYANQILTFVVPTSLPSGYTAPSNLYASFYSNPTAITPQLNILSSNDFGDILGFSSGSYPATLTETTDQSFISDITPNATVVNSLILRCNLCDNNVVMPSDILDSFTPTNVTFGSNLVYEPKYQANIKLKAGTYSNITFTIVDQNFNNIIMNDPNVCITLLLTIK